jgi:hypothetical protein
LPAPIARASTKAGTPLVAIFALWRIMSAGMTVFRFAWFVAASGPGLDAASTYL